MTIKTHIVDMEPIKNAGWRYSIECSGKKIGGGVTEAVDLNDAISEVFAVWGIAKEKACVCVSG